MSISKVRNRAIFHGLTCTPLINSGRATGRKTVVPTISKTISPTAEATSPLAIPTTLGKNGAPAASPSNKRPSANGSSNRSSRAVPTDNSGTMMKFMITARTMSFTFLSGAMICDRVSPRPIPDMLETRNSRTRRRVTAVRVSVMPGCWASALAAMRPIPREQGAVYQGSVLRQRLRKNSISSRA